MIIERSIRRNPKVYMKKNRNFLIVGTQRTGSSALAEAIDNRGEIACGWEWTQNVAPWKKIQLAKLGLEGKFTGLKENHRQHMERTMTDKCQLLGFRRLFRASNKWVIHPRLAPALLIDRLEAHVSWLKKHQDILIIHIVRDDNIEWLKSKYVSKVAGSYIGKSYPEKLRVAVPINDAISRLKSKAWIDQRLADLKQTNRYLLIRYEDFLKQPDEVTATTLNFLGADASIRRGATQISRQSKGTASDYIANFDKLSAKLLEKGLLRSSV